MRNRVLAMALLSTLLGLLAGCGASDADDGNAPVALPRQGSIRVVHVMPDAGRMTSFLSNSVFSANQFGEATVLAQQLVGQYVMNIVLTPPTDVPTTLVDNANADLADEDEFSFIMIGTTANPQLVRIDNVEIGFDVDPSKPAQFPLPDYQILHASTSTGAVDVYVTDAAADLAAATPSATVSFGNVTPLVQLDPAVSYRVRVTPAGDKTVLFDSGSFTVARLRRSIYLLLDNFGPTGESLRVANVTAAAAEDFPNQTMQAALRAANMIPDAPLVDIYLGTPSGTPLFQNVAYGTTTPYSLAVTNGSFTANVTPAGVPGTIIATANLSIVGGQARSIYTSGLDGNDTAALSTLVESQRSITGQAQFRFVQAAPSAGTVDVYLATPGQPISDASPILANGVLLASSTANLTPGSYDLFVARTGSTVQLFGPERISVDAGAVYSAVLFDAAGGGGPLQLQLTREVLP
jgi:hypothetical protein